MFSSIYFGYFQNDKTHYETDRFCGNSLGVSGARGGIGGNNGSPADAQTVVSFKKPFNIQVPF